ncbi:MAG TPA: tetratricopeptide repeat protein [Cyclobacteriaceae bacterium]|nr:tetratricopeptide repeat protein [Cyclobacteriaceae bacterium]
MGKVVQFPISSSEKFGFKPVRKKKSDVPDKKGQLNLFVGGKVVKLNQLTPFEEALLLDDMGDSEKARELYLKAIKHKDSLADAYCNLGIIESEARHYSKAIDCFTLCLKEDPRHFEAHYNLANQYAEIGNLPLAKVHYQLSIEIEPEFPNSYFNLGLTLAMNKEIDEAIQALLNYRNMAAVEDKKQAEDLINMLVRGSR